MMRAATLLWGFMAAIAGTGLFLLKYQVQAEERHLRELHKDIAGTEQSIHVLKAEWSYLNDPLRLREQAERHLDMHPMRANQIVTIDSIPMIGAPSYDPPGMVIVKNGLPTQHHDHHGGGAKKPAAAPSVKPQARTMTAQAVKPTSTAQAVKPTSTAQAVKPTSTAQAVKPTSTAQAVKPTSTAQAVKPTSTAQAVKPTSTAQAVKPTTPRSPEVASSRIRP